MPENRFNDDLGKLILRLTVGLLVLQHGVSTLLQAGALEQLSRNFVDLGLPSVMAYSLYLGEIVAPLMIIFGICARLAGLILALYTAAALWLPFAVGVWGAESDSLVLEHQVFYLFGAFTIALLGSGRIAIRPNRLKVAHSIFSAQPISASG